MKSLTAYQISYDYLQKCLDYEAFCLGKVLIFSPPLSLHRDFLLISTSIGMLHVYLFKALKIIDLFMCVPNLLFRDCLSSLLLKFKVGPILKFP